MGSGEQYSVHLMRKLFEEAKLRNPRYSLRSFAQTLGLSSGALSEIISGKRTLTVKQKVKIVDKLSLSPQERKQFLAEEIAEHMGERQTRYQLVSEDQFRLISDWWHFALLNLLKTKGFQPRPLWMAKRLGLSRETIREAWQRLQRMKFLKRGADGRFRRGSPNLKTSFDAVSLSNKKSHLMDLPLIERALRELSTEERYTSSITFAIKKKDMGRAKVLIDQFLDEFLEVIEPAEGDEVYRLSASLFPLTVVEQRKKNG